MEPIDRLRQPHPRQAEIDQDSVAALRGSPRKRLADTRNTAFVSAIAHIQQVATEIDPVEGKVLLCAVDLIVECWSQQVEETMRLERRKE